MPDNLHAFVPASMAMPVCHNTCILSSAGEGGSCTGTDLLCEPQEACPLVHVNGLVLLLRLQELRKGLHVGLTLRHGYLQQLARRVHVYDLLPRRLRQQHPTWSGTAPPLALVFVPVPHSPS